MQNLTMYQTNPWDDVIKLIEVVPGTEASYSNLHATWDEAHHYLYHRARMQVEKMEMALKEARDRMCAVERQLP